MSHTTSESDIYRASFEIVFVLLMKSHNFSEAGEKHNRGRRLVELLLNNSSLFNISWLASNVTKHKLLQYCAFTQDPFQQNKQVLIVKISTINRLIISEDT